MDISIKNLFASCTLIVSVVEIYNCFSVFSSEIKHYGFLKEASVEFIVFFFVKNVHTLCDNEYYCE